LGAAAGLDDEKPAFGDHRHQRFDSLPLNLTCLAQIEVGGAQEPEDRRGRFREPAFAGLAGRNRDRGLDHSRQGGG
jgi:hypothetical protein